MKVLHIRAKTDINVKDIVSKIRLKCKLGLVTTIQLTHILKELHKQLPNSVIGGQILGCNVSLAKKIINKVDAFLYIGSGEFHPLQIALECNKPVYWLNPFSLKLNKVPLSDIEKRKRRIKAGYLKYLSSDKIGLLVSTKSGQNNLKQALEFKRKHKDKTFYIFLFNTLNFSELENFPDIECWVNTACPRIAIEDYDKFLKPVINLHDIEHASIYAGK
jgi:2-(3-amino-3-carboxypropyl)histidine synthase